MVALGIWVLIGKKMRELSEIMVAFCMLIMSGYTGIHIVKTHQIIHIRF